MRVVAIGFDAAEWSYVQARMAAGDMPRLAELVSRGRVAPLHANDERNEYVWAEFLRGEVLGREADWQTHRFDPERYVASLAHAQPGPRFWDRATGRVVTLDVPQVTARERAGDVHVVGWGGAQVFGPRSAQPRGLLREIDARFGPHPMVRNDQMGWHHARRIDDVVRAMEHGARRRADVARFLLDRFPDWQLFMTVWAEMHTATEFLWHGEDSYHLLGRWPTAGVAADGLRRVYRAVDDGVGALVDELPEGAAVVVFSLNGLATGPGDTPSTVLLPELLLRLQHGRPLLVPDDPHEWARTGYRPVAPAPCQRGGYFSARRIDASRQQRLVQQVLAALPEQAWPLQHGVRRAWAATRKVELGPLGMTIPPERDVDEAVLAERTPFSQVVEWYQPWWHQMPAFALPSFAHGYVRMNVAGRERNGVVAIDNYDRAVTVLEHDLTRCTSPRTGAPVVRNLVRTRDATPRSVLDPEGPYADLVVEWAPCVDAIEHPTTGVIGPFPLQRVAAHTRNGFALVCGTGVEPGSVTERPATVVPDAIRSLLADGPRHTVFAAPARGLATR
jgi:predicted AlkP superfamily phosphohydrolase/phosphomutase